MSQIEVLKSALDKEIDQYTYGLSPLELYEPIRYLMNLQGKRLRPLLTLLAANLYTDDWQQAIKPAHAVELFHNFTLMHDDIMDKAPLRRGHPTVHSKWDENTAILSGDVMLVKAYSLFLDLPAQLLPDVLKRFSKAAAEVCEGQQLDMNFETMSQLSIEEYLEMIRLKTSVLLGFSLELGGCVGQAPAAAVSALYEAGVNMGLGFQLKDDLLDVYGDPSKFGKQIGGDILSNKKTFLYLKALELADSDTRQELEHRFAEVAADGEEKIRSVKAIYNRLGVRKSTEELIKAYFDQANQTLLHLPVAQEKLQPLLSFTERLMHREK